MGGIGSVWNAITCIGSEVTPPDDLGDGGEPLSPSSLATLFLLPSTTLLLPALPLASIWLATCLSWDGAHTAA